MDIPREERQRIEKQWKRWQKKIKLRKLLWQLRMDKAVSGEGFAVQIQNQRLKHPVKLDFRVIEADCVTSPVEHLSVNHAIAPSIPLCAVARRYTMALVRCAEIQACLAAVLESDIPNYRNLQTPPTRTVEIKDEHGQVIGTEQVTDEDDGPMFDLMPIEMGSFNLLPQGFRFKTWDRVPVG